MQSAARGIDADQSNGRCRGPRGPSYIIGEEAPMKSVMQTLEQPKLQPRRWQICDMERRGWRNPARLRRGSLRAR